MISISSKHDGFRRCGIAHSAAPTDYPDDRFTSEELEQLQAEPMLVVESQGPGNRDRGQGKPDSKRLEETLPVPGSRSPKSGPKFPVPGT